MKRSFDWSLKVFWREKIRTYTRYTQVNPFCHKKQFNSFIREMDIKAEKGLWEDEAIEACVTKTTFKKIFSAPLQSPREWQNINVILDAIATLTKAKDNFEFTAKHSMLISNKLTKHLIMLCRNCKIRVAGWFF